MKQLQGAILLVMKMNVKSISNQKQIFAPTVREKELKQLRLSTKNWNILYDLICMNEENLFLTHFNIVRHMGFSMFPS